MPAPQKIAVVLFQLGGPDRPEAVEPFLYNLFCDPEIINFMGAGIARKPLAKLIVQEAPHTTVVGRLDETTAARKPILRYQK